MKLAITTSRTLWAALIQTALAAVGSGFGALLVGLPGPGGEAPLALLIALLGALLIAPGIVSTWPEDRTVPSRRSGAIALTLVLLQIAPALLIALAFGVFGNTSGLSYAGMFLWLLAIQLAAGVMISATFQGVAPAVYVMLCALLGRIDGVVQPWAWPLAGIQPVHALLLGALAFVVASVLLVAVGFGRVLPAGATSP